MFPDFGGLELLLILVVSLLVLGPEKLPEAARSLAKFLAKWRLTFNRIKTDVETEIGMDGGGVWTKKGKLVGIHGYREVSREENLLLSRGSHGTGIHIPYWKQLIDPFDPSKGFPQDLEKNNEK